MSATPKSSWPWVKTVLQTVFDQPDKKSVHAQFDRALDALEHKLPRSFAHLEAAREEILAFNGFPEGDLEEDLVEQPHRAAQQEIRVVVASDRGGLAWHRP